MGESEHGDRTERPTARRLQQARRRGEVPRSRDLSAALVTLAGGAGLYLLGGVLGGRLVALMQGSMGFSRAAAMDAGQILPALGSASLQGLLALAPVLGLLLAAALLAPLLIGGWNFSAEPLALNWSRLDPVAGLGRMFSLRGTIELLKALARVAVVAVVAVLLLRVQLRQFQLLGAEPVAAAIAHALALAGGALITLGGALGLIALLDVPLTLWQHQRALRMTREEIREESKEVDGHPEIRGRIRRVQQELARRRMMQEVPRADVVITNPTHYAVALRYEDRRMRAPVVVAKGTELVALRIRELAAAHQVPLVEAAPLARALHASCDLGDEIPARLYAAVAQVLTYVYQLRTARRRGQHAPSPPRLDPPPPPPHH
ncbi:MAG: flagellar biosynthesis protein FlhB [Gammaproteobacteria bacterium]|nr:flagellar biosynthesis protein FlhB [Gammaproteobacteria bacterium]